MPPFSTAIRLNPFKGCEGPEGKPVAWSRYGRILSERPNFTLDPLFHAGCYYVQDSSAMYVGYIFRKYIAVLETGAAKGASAASAKCASAGAEEKSSAGADGQRGGKGVGPVIRVLDLCAAPGGKTSDLSTSLREAFGDNFSLIANEVIKSRAAALKDNAARWGDSNVVVTSADPAIFGRNMTGYFDAIIADVPCSGEGMFRKSQKAIEDWSPATVDLCAARQKRILGDVWPALKEGGLLVYSTCTYEDKENDDNLEWAADTLGGEIFRPENEFAEYGVRLTRHGNLLKAGEVPGEGQWVGALRKTAASPVTKKPIIPSPLALEESDRVLAINYAPEYPVVELELSDALKYLHRDALYLPDAPKGLIIAAYKSHPLGLAKNLGTRCNNLLPKSRRILMDV